MTGIDIMFWGTMIIFIAYMALINNNLTPRT